MLSNTNGLLQGRISGMLVISGSTRDKSRVAKLGSLSLGAKMAMKVFVKRIYNFRDKCVIFARNCKFVNLTQ